MSSFSNALLGNRCATAIVVNDLCRAPTSRAITSPHDDVEEVPDDPTDEFDAEVATENELGEREICRASGAGGVASLRSLARL
jgi:hypothetical protein